MDSIDEKLRKLAWLEEHVKELEPEEQLKVFQETLKLANKIEYIYDKYNLDIRILDEFSFREERTADWKERIQAKIEELKQRGED